MRQSLVPQARAACLAFAILMAAASGPACSSAAETKAQTFTPDWRSLEAHPMPEWLVDAKFGIYALWSAYAVPAFLTEHYPKRMYEPGTKFFENQVKNWGHPSKFGYKDFIPLFKAERYDPDEWAKFIEASGARYAGLAVVHHDGFLLWDSSEGRWNAKQMGPKRDIYGELVAALRKRGLKTIATEHHMRTFNWEKMRNPTAISTPHAVGWVGQETNILICSSRLIRSVRTL